MKVKELIKQLEQTNENREVRIDFGGEKDTMKEYSKTFYLSFDDSGDVLIYEVEEEDNRKDNNESPYGQD